jgi:uncharacterized protein YndB with AHSA1/START domain
MTNPERLKMTNPETLKVRTPTDCEIVLARVFDAPRQMVFDALTRPELLKRWFAPPGWSLAVCEVDLKAGGRFRFVMERPGGGRTGMRGVWREIAAPERLVHTESFDDFPGESQITTEFAEQNGRTTLTITSLSPSREVRDAILKGGTDGMAQSYDKLAEILAASTEMEDADYQRPSG